MCINNGSFFRPENTVFFVCYGEIGIFETMCNEKDKCFHTLQFHNAFKMKSRKRYTNTWFDEISPHYLVTF